MYVQTHTHTHRVFCAQGRKHLSQPWGRGMDAELTGKVFSEVTKAENKGELPQQRKERMVKAGWGWRKAGFNLLTKAS